MDTPTLETPPTLSPCATGRLSSDSNSPEFEFWMLRNPSFPQPNLLSADELFVDGVLLPLHLLHHHNSDDPPDSNPHTPKAEPATTPKSSPYPDSDIVSGPELSTAPPESSAVGPTASKRWRDIFKKSDRKNTHGNNSEDKEKEKDKKKERKSGGAKGTSSAELNINIWPFSRSRSAGNGGNRPRMAAGSAATRKVSSAPCSRSNSAGESKSRKWPSSPSRGGVHLGRSSPVWQVRRAGSGGRGFEPAIRNAEKGIRKEGSEARRSKAAAAFHGGEAKARVLNLNVPMCMGYRQHLSCRSDGNSAVCAAAPGGGSGGGQSGGGGSGDSGRGNLFNLRSFFTKKVY